MKQEVLDQIVASNRPFIFEFIDGAVYIGYLTTGYAVLSLDQSGTLTFARSNLKRAISLDTWLICTGSNSLKFIDIFEFNELVDRAGYEAV